MNKTLVITLAFLMCGLGLQAQTSHIDPETGISPCHTMEIDAMRRATDPSMGSLEDFEAWMQEMIARAPQDDAARSVFTLPIVFHVIHQGEAVGVGSNLSQARINDQIEVLIEDFRKMPGTPGFNTNPVGADAEIEFCPAYIAPDGSALAEPGIDRVDVNTLGVTVSPPYVNNTIENQIKPPTGWDPTQYMNVWVVAGVSGSGGYAYIPNVPGIPSGNAPAVLDGIVIPATSVGRFPGGGLRRSAMSHEMGHFLALYHTWGPGNQGQGGGCSADDFCADTPNTIDATFGCPSNLVTCTDPIMAANFMDYTSCQNVFTEDQKTRMRAAMMFAVRRMELLTSTVCDVPATVPGAAFTWGDTATCDGTIQFFDQSDPIATSWFWVFSDGQISTVKNPVMNFAASGPITAILTANNLNGTSQLSQTLNVAVGGSPNTSAGPDISACFGDVFQLNATTDDLNATVSWFPTSGLSDPSVLNPLLGAIDTRTYYLTVTSANGCAVTDTLNVTVSPSPTTLGLPIGGATINPGDSVQLNALGADFYVWTPATGLSNANIANPWAKPTVTTSYTVTGFNAAGCTKIDEVLITVPGTISIQPNEFDALGAIHPAFPNPATQRITFSAELAQEGTLSLQLFDLRGKPVAKVFEGRVIAGPFSHDLDRADHLASGLYFAVWEMSGKRFVEKIRWQ